MGNKDLLPKASAPPVLQRPSLSRSLKEFKVFDPDFDVDSPNVRLLRGVRPAILFLAALCCLPVFEFIEKENKALRLEQPGFVLKYVQFRHKLQEFFLEYLEVEKS